MKKDDLILDKEVLPNPVDKDMFCDEYWRVKVFELNAENTWMDCGTGLASIIQNVEFL